MKNIKIRLTPIVTLLVVVLWASASMSVEAVRSTFKIDSLSCGACLFKLNYELHRLSGVYGLEADMPEKLVVVIHEPALKTEKIAKSLDELGYPALIVSAEQVSGNYTKQDVSQQKSGINGGCGIDGGSCCGATASAWKELYKRYLKNKNVSQIK